MPRPHAGFPDIPEQRENFMASIVTAAEVSKNFGPYQDAAASEPVMIAENGRQRAVLLPYREFMRLSKCDCRVERIAEMSEAEMAAVDAAEMTLELEHFNASATSAYAAD